MSTWTILDGDEVIKGQIRALITLTDDTNLM